MKKYLLIASERHPEIRLSDGLISIKGHSIPRDSRKLYRPVLQWIRAYVRNPAPRTVVLLQIDFFDSGSTKAIFDILKELAICHNANQEIEMIIKWIYLKEDASIKELGEFFESKLNLKFNFHEKTSDFGQELLEGFN